jgi:hypothetical protein
VANALLFGAEALRKGFLPAVGSELERAGAAPAGGAAGVYDGAPSGETAPRSDIEASGPAAS